MNRDSRRTRVVLVLLVLASFTLITLDFRSGKAGGFTRVRTFAVSVFGPVERAIADVVDPIGRTFSSVVHVGRYRAEVAALSRRNAALLEQLRLQASRTHDSAELSALLDLAGRARYRIVPARVVALGAAIGFDWVATIDAGSQDGLRVNQTVINGAGLVGRLVVVGPSTSQILLAIDPEVTVAARLSGSGQLGTVTGGGLGPMVFQSTDPTVHPTPGEGVLTFGSLYPGGIPVGTVTGVATAPGALTASAAVRPLVDFTALDIVGVVVAQQRSAPHGSLLPPVPTVTVTVTATPSPAASPTSSPAGGGAAGSGATPTPSPSG